MTTDTPSLEVAIDVPDELVRRAAEENWPDGLVRRARELYVPVGDIDYWLTHDDETVEEIERYLDRKERLMSGTLRVREATWEDDEAIAELYANAPEEIGDFEVTTERSPYPFAQFRLQEHVNIQVLEDRGVALAASAHSARNCMIGGKRVSVHVQTAFRVRKEARGMGMSHYLRTSEGPATSWFGMLSYYYVRTQNVGAVGWIRAIQPEAFANTPNRENEIPGLPVTVHYLPARASEGDASGIRPGRRDDIAQCVSLINRTHEGLDLFRPYNEAFLERRLDDSYRGPPIYGWEDFHVREEESQIVACAGLWDRGRHMREVWRHKQTGETQMTDDTALMDFGFAEGRDDAMAGLIEYLAGETERIGRDRLIAPLQFLPKLAGRLAPLEPASETRALQWQSDDDMKELNLKIERPYTDLAYW